jgi:hypothetical protein
MCSALFNGSCNTHYLNNVPELLNQQEHSDLCFRSLVWALSPTSTGLSGTKVFKHNNLEHRHVVKQTYDSEQKTATRKARVEMRLDSEMRCKGFEGVIFCSSAASCRRFSSRHDNFSCKMCCVL